MQGVTQAVPNSTGAAPPKLIAPAKNADCHIHIYDARYAHAGNLVPNSTVADYRLLQKRIGLERVVIVTPRCYGTDNTVTTDAIRELGINNARGVGVLRPTVTDAELKQLNDAGIRGIRFTVGDPKTAVVSIDMIEPLAKRIAEYGTSSSTCRATRLSNTPICCGGCRHRWCSITWVIRQLQKAYATRRMR